MNKKILLLGAAFMGIASLPSEARIGGFYAGIQGGIDLAQFKIYDGSKCDPATVTGDPKFGSRGQIPYDNGSVVTLYVRNGESATDTASVTGNAFCSGSDEHVGQDTTYKVRPAGAIFLGYNYQVTPNVVVGVELVGGMTFGTHTYEGPIKLQPLTHHTASISGGALTTGSSTYPTAYSDMKFEMDTKFVGDASLRVGFVLPGTDGRFAVFARGGVGFQNREIKAHLGNIDPYVLAASAAFHSAIKKGQFETNAAARKAANIADNASGLVNSGDATTPQEQALRKYVDKMASFMPLRVAASANVYSKPPKNGYIPIVAAGETIQPTDLNSDQNLQNIVSHFVSDSQGTDILSNPGANQMGNISKSETKFTWHVGGDLEYHFASGLFVRASYTFRYAKGFFAEGETALKTSSKVNFTLSDVAGWLQGQVFMKSTDSNSTTPSATLLNSSELLASNAKKIFDTAKSMIEATPSYTIANLKSRYGTGDKSYHHEFAVGIGFRFCG